MTLSGASPETGLAEPVVTELWAFDGMDLELGDVSGDGLADLVAKPTGQPPRVEVYLAVP
jgi:hypothetical protein